MTDLSPRKLLTAVRTRGVGLASAARAGAGDLALLIGFFSRLPVPDAGAGEPPSLPRAVALMPVAGLIVALPGALTLLVFGASSLPSLAVAVLAVAAGGLATGFLHEDGLSDMADGLIGGRSRDHRLEIMRDSRIGAFGAVALVLVLLMKVVLLGAALERFGLWPAAALVLLVAAVSRTAMVLFWAGLPAARTDGLSASIGQPETRSVLIALTVAGGLALLASPMLGLAGVLAGLGLVGVLLIALSIYADAKIGGQTGDVLGGMQQLAEIGVLVGVLM